VRRGPLSAPQGRASALAAASNDMITRFAGGRDQPGGRGAAVSFNQLLVDQAQVSLNFAAFPMSSPGGERLGAGPALRLWRDERPSQPVQVLADRLAVPSPREAPARMGPPASSASDPQPTYPESGSRHSGPRPSSSPPHGSSGSDFIADRSDCAKHGGAGWPEH
jgi:hypothetical protein